MDTLGYLIFIFCFSYDDAVDFIKHKQNEDDVDIIDIYKDGTNFKNPASNIFCCKRKGIDVSLITMRKVLFPDKIIDSSNFSMFLEKVENHILKGDNINQIYIPILKLNLDSEEIQRNLTVINEIKAKLASKYPFSWELSMCEV